MKYTLTIRIQPEAPFGVPQSGVTVVPARPGTITGPTLHSDTGVIVGYGTLSVYRPDEEAIRLEIQTPAGSVRIHDNFAFIEVEAPNPSKAYRLGASMADRLLQHLSLNQGQLFTFESLILEGEDRSLHRVPALVPMGSFSSYNLQTMCEALREASAWVGNDNHRLILAIDYYQQGLLLFSRRDSIANPLFRQYSMLISAAFLNMWKAISTIVGDPSVDSDYQSRYKTLGLDHDFFRDKIEKVRSLRNEFDVAHYSLRIDDIKSVEAAFGEATQVAAEVIKRYRATLAASWQLDGADPANSAR